MDWMPVSEAASVLGVSERTIYNRIKTHKIEARQVTGRTEVLAIAGRRVDAWGRALAPRVSTSAQGGREGQREGIEAVGRLADSLESQIGVFNELHRAAVRSRRLAWGGCLVAFLGLACGAYWHRDQLAERDSAHREAYLALERRCVDIEAAAACGAAIAAERRLAGGP